jgi:hypothetical protein
MKYLLFYVGAVFICFSILFVVEIEVVRHEETVTSSRYVFMKHTVSSCGMERPVWEGDTQRRGCSSHEESVMECVLRWLFVCYTFINISV